ncbi:MAG: site-specific DNA-methyltransferase [Methanomicrobiales archaeon]|nr:site-specific DNA-methyltransferase [Methanomicrobiales archaeon]
MLERNRIYTLDCREGLTMLDPGTVDVIVTSPPYNIGTGYHTYRDQMPQRDYISWLQEVVSGCRQVMKENASLFFVMGGTLKNPWIPLEAACAFRSILVLQNMIHWIKSITIPCEYLIACPASAHELQIGQKKPDVSDLHHPIGHEFIFHFTKHGDVHLGKFPTEEMRSGTGAADQPTNTEVRDPGNAWFIPDAQPGETRHPAVFPVRLARACIVDHGSGSTSLVLDPFMGIGSTALACLELGADFIGFEIDPAYAAIANQRIREWKQKEKRF